MHLTLLDRINAMMVFIRMRPLSSDQQETHDRKTSQQSNPIHPVDYRCDYGQFCLSAHNCQVPTPTSQNLELEQQVWIFGTD